MSDYGTGAVSSLKQKDSLIADHGRLHSRLLEAQERLCKIADGLFGPAPRDASGAKNTPPPANSVRRIFDLTSDTISQIEGELSRIEALL